MSKYIEERYLARMPRLPFEGNLDLTYRCNNNCRHCWTRIRPHAPELQKELDYDRIRRIVDEARKMGTREWLISGGEPMLRPDFAEIFDYITARSAGYSINTNGTLITPQIAGLLKRKGRKMVALYGPNDAVHDHITRTPGSFDAVSRGMAYLREAGAGFIVQLVPMRDNYDHWNAMIELALSYSPVWRTSLPWLYFSAARSSEKNSEIAAQRLPPEAIIGLDDPSISYGARMAELIAADRKACAPAAPTEDRLLAGCINGSCSFHIDPYGGMSACQYLKDPSLRYDLTSGSFRTAWEEFLPSIGEAVRGDDEWRNNCGSCENRPHCRWCPVYGWLEMGRFSAPVPYLCQIAAEVKQYKENWATRHQRYFDIGGITIRFESRLPADEIQFEPSIQLFEAPGPGNDVVTLRHEFELPDVGGMDLGTPWQTSPPWDIYRKDNSIVYVARNHECPDSVPYQVATFCADYSHGIIYNPPILESLVRDKKSLNLTTFASDQVLIAQLLASRQGCYLHAAGHILNGRGLLFVGHSGAGKSTITEMLRGKTEILCDDRIIVRRLGDELRIFGTWSHGDVPDVSPNNAPLAGIFLLKKSGENRLVRVNGRRQRLAALLPLLIKPVVAKEWWEKVLDLIDYISRTVPCYEMHFDESGSIVPQLTELVNNGIR